ncbi:MAG TPA: carboxymuconolactone decarboxylase family protein [Candidatus Acidoferrales bacterium]|nr:carboxymuconolactone decarboxylase family protein [Candidatus Acidoferrales bacterium]
MATIPLIERKEDLSAPDRPIYDAIAQSRGRVQGPFAALLHSPALAERTALLGSYVRFESTLQPAVAELAVLVTAREFDCKHEWAAHIEHALKAGLSLATIRSVHQRNGPEGFAPDEAQIVSYVRQLLRAHAVDEPTLRALCGRLGVKGLVELTATVGYYAMLACTLNAFDIVHATPPEDLSI